MEPIGYEEKAPARLDATFAALADPTRRAIIARLASGDASVTELAAPFAMSQPAISKHLRVLERAGLISRGQDAQRRPRRLEARRLAEANEWLERYREFWEANFRSLDALLVEMKARKKTRPRPKTWEIPMKDHGRLTITTPSDRELAMIQVFDAPRELVFEAYTTPALLRRWLGVHNNWALAVCEIDLRPGGRYRYEWRGPGGVSMGMGGTFREVTFPERIVATEKFDESWYPGEAESTITLVEQGGKTTLTLSVRYESKEARDAVLQSPMEEGVAIGFDTLAEILGEMKQMADGS